ncbi:[protein-PII] uridylyltransferase [Microlunatus panaciterrae]
MRSPWETTAGPDRRRLMSESVERALVELYAEVGAPTAGVALAAVGSLGRRELGPRSDIDLVLLHDGTRRRDINALAESLWYPLWDSRIRLDYSVRTAQECIAVAAHELSAGVGLLDLRAIAGDAELVAGTRSALLAGWRNGARKRLPELLTSIDERSAQYGDAAYLLEPDLKEARGGFRDMTMLRALAATWLTDRPHDSVRQPYQRLLDVRDGLHLSSGRTLDRLLAAEAPEVARLLGYAAVDDLRREVSLDARRIGHAVDLTVRAARQVLPPKRVMSFARKERKPVYSRAEHGLIIHLGEVGLDRLTTPSTPLIDLRAGALASQRGLVLSPVTAANLGEHAPTPPTPWPVEAREALLQLLAGGQHLIPVWEALELAGCVSRWIPQWEAIRAQPQHNPIHRHTVDRHSIQAVAEAAPALTQVERPDVLLLACLLHDIGKQPGAGADHAELGAPIARQVVEAMGLPSRDADLVERLVRHHLTLAELATRRDHADPATSEALVEAVDGRAEVLRLLRRLTEADARAAGPSAWSPWRAQLINALADRVESRLAGEEHTPDTKSADVGLARSVRLDGQPRIRLESAPGGIQLVIAAQDRLGLFSDTAGLLAAHAISVRSAALSTIDGIGVNTWRVDKQLAADLPDLAYLVKQLERLQDGDPTVLAAVRRREARSGADAALSSPHVALIESASDSAAVVEVRTTDRSGLLYALGRALSDRRLSIRSAHISTLAGQAIDTFYLTEVDQSAPNPARAREAVQVLTEAALGSAAQPV